MSKIWKKTNEVLPAEGQLVETMSENGIQQQLKRRGHLWFDDEEKIYVYYTPILWTEIS